MVYLYIFISKILENMLATLRLILVANGKKYIGALLQGLIASLWVLVIGIIITDINNDLFKIIFFIIGSIVGSYIGSILEEKIALGDILIIVKTLNAIDITNYFNKDNFFIYKNYIFFIVKRKKAKEVIKRIKKIDVNSKIISQKIKINYGKLTT